jgi:hypothetical protein
MNIGAREVPNMKNQAKNGEISLQWACPHGL